MIFSLIIISRKHTSLFKFVNRKEHIFYILYPCSYFLISYTPIKYYYQKDKNSFDILQALYSCEDPKTLKLLHWCKKVSVIIFIILLFNIITLISLITTNEEINLLKGRYIERPAYGESAKEVKLNVMIDDVIKKSITLNIEEQKFTEEQLESRLKKAKKYIDKVILGQNKSKDEIIYPLKLIKKIPDTGITVLWDLGTEGFINKDGSIHNEEIKQPGEITQLTATLKYGEVQAEYSFFLMVKPKDVNKEEKPIENILMEIEGKQNQFQTERQVELPSKIDNHKLYYTEKKDKQGTNLLLLGILLAFILGYKQDRDIVIKMRKRELELLIDYPEVMNKFTLLLGAGMTIKQAWGRITGEYVEKYNSKGIKKRYAYEELLITWHEITNGVSETSAFDNFGKRVKLLPYLKFSSLLTQNLRKGSKGLLELLELEAVDAFEERKSLTKRLGEEAGTKLLIPMMIMLLIVLLLIMLPAFMTL